MARELSRLGHKVTIATLHPDFASLEQTHFHRDGVDVWYVAPMHVRKQGNQKSYYTSRQLIGVTMRATIALTRAALSIPADIVHVGKPHPMNSVAGLLASRVRGDGFFWIATTMRQLWVISAASGKGVVCRFSKTTCRGTFSNHYPHHLQSQPIDNAGRSPGQYHLPAERSGPPEVRGAQPAAVEALRGELGLTGRQVVGYFGSLSLPSHPLGLLAEAFGLICSSRPGTALLLVGGGEAFEKLEATVPGRGGSQSVIFAGRVPPELVPQYYRLANVSVDPVFNDDMHERAAR